jgi:hypothetical protein
MRDREAESTEGCRRELELNAGNVQLAPRLDANWLIIKAIGDTWDASSEDGHADFVTETTSSRGGAVFHPDAIIPFKPVRPTDLISHLAGLFLISSKL